MSAQGFNWRCAIGLHAWLPWGTPYVWPIVRRVSAIATGDVVSERTTDRECQDRTCERCGLAAWRLK